MNHIEKVSDRRTTSRPHVTEFRLMRMWPVLVLLVPLVAFSGPILELIRFSMGSEIYSYIILIPAVSGYLAWTHRRGLTFEPHLNRNIAIGLACGSAILIGVHWLLSVSGVQFARADRLALTTGSFLLLFAAFCAWLLAPQTLRRVVFPLAFLAFMVPLPTAILAGVETFLQHGSAFLSRALFELTGTPVFSHALDLQLPGITLHVAPECSGIRSTVVLLITSVVGGYSFLRRKSHRTILAVAVVPIALLRNGIRIFTIGELCVHIGPHMIDSDIHHKGGPIFFGLSLIPFFLLLYFLMRRERRGTHTAPNSV